MVLAFDTTRAPLRPDEFVGLVRAVAGARDGDENHWIEWKGSLDLRSAEGKAAVARCVVGLANRTPDTAARFCEGRGYMVIGAEPGKIGGVPEEDPADLTQWWTPYLGSDGPRWLPHWAELDGQMVLVIEVAPPRKGDPIFTIRRETTGVRDGDVFIRRVGMTDRATSAEIAALVDRVAGANQLAGVMVQFARPSAVRPVSFGGQALADWIGASRAECLSSLRRAQRKDRSDSRLGGLLGDAAMVRSSWETMAEVAAASAGLWRTEPEDRTAAEYESEVATYLGRLRSALPQELHAAASRILEPCVLAIKNETASNLPEVRLVAHVPGEDAAAVLSRRHGRGLPSAPRPFRSTTG